MGITIFWTHYSCWIFLNSGLEFNHCCLKHFGKEPSVNSVMLEIRRDQYMDESNMVVDSERINLLKSMLTEIISKT